MHCECVHFDDVCAGAPVHPDRAALFGASHLVPAPHMDMHDGDPRDYSRTPPPPIHAHHHHQSPPVSFGGGGGGGGGGVTHRRPPTPESMTRSYGDQTNNNMEYSGQYLYLYSSRISPPYFVHCGCVSMSTSLVPPPPIHCFATRTKSCVLRMCVCGVCRRS